MKATINTMDLRIATAMKEAANVVFNAMPKTQDVNITSMQVYQHFTDAKKVFPGLAKDLEWLANIPVCSGDGWEIGADAEITINIDSYSCKLYGIAIFYYLNTFERIAGVKDRARFTYSMPKTETAKVMTITVDKNAVDILAHADNSGIRPVLQGVYVDFKYHNIIATDGHTIQVMRCEIVGNVPNIAGVVIPSNIAKRVLKARVFTLSVDGTMCVCGNECFTFDSYLPAYYRVFPSFINESDQFIKLAPKAWNVVRKQAQSAKKNDNRHFVFRALSGEHKITVDVYSDLIWNKEGKFEGVLTNTFIFDIETASPVSFTKAFSVEYLLRFKTVESIQGLDDSRAMCMYNGNSISLAMPYKVYNVNDNYILFTDDSKNKHFAPVDAYKVERINEPVERVETINEPVEHVETINEPVVTVETINEPVEHVETINEPVERVETINEPVVTVETINEPVERVETINEPVERVETINEPVVTVETINEPVEPVEIVPDSRMSATAFISSFVAMMAACILAFVVFVVKPSTMPAAAAPVVATVATVSEAADVVTIEAEINDVICTGSFDRYYNRVKEEITRNYRDIMKSQRYELADLASVDDSEVFAALETSETDTETPESVPTVETITDTENTPESVEIMPTETDTDTETGTVSDNTEIDYNSSEYVELSVTTIDANGNQVVNIYTVPLNE